MKMLWMWKSWVRFLSRPTVKKSLSKTVSKAKCTLWAPQEYNSLSPEWLTTSFLALWLPAMSAIGEVRGGKTGGQIGQRQTRIILESVGCFVNVFPRTFQFWYVWHFQKNATSGKNFCHVSCIFDYMPIYVKAFSLTRCYFSVGINDLIEKN